MTKAPDFYDPNRIGALFHPNMAAIAEAAAGASLPPAAEDAVQRHLLIIDMQIDFCHVNGSLYVPGALEDIRNTIEFIYANAEKISRITCSLDSHLPTQIFAPAWWADAGGNHPAPFTLISAADVESGRWRALQAPEWSAEYVRRLEQEARKQLTIWPYHVLIGSIGNAMDPELWSAIFWHSLARKVEPHFLQKGTVPRTEHYSIIQPEVPIPGEAAAQKNQYCR